MEYEDNFKDSYVDNIGINLDNCLNIIRGVHGIKKENKIIYKVIEVNLNGIKYVDCSLCNTDDLSASLNLKFCENQTFKVINLK